MWIKLSDDGPAMWFLGSPRAIRLSLNFDNPGPVDIDFESLSDLEQNQIMSAVREGKLESGTPFQDLYRIWGKKKGEELAAAIPDDQPIQTPIQEQILEGQKKENEREAVKRECDTKFEERCKFILRQSGLAIKNAIASEKNMKLWLALLQMEREQ
jgi:hypothetical protein